MNKHWKNLLIREQRNRRAGHTLAASSHGDTPANTKNRDERRSREMGAAFCDRGRAIIPLLDGS